MKASRSEAVRMGNRWSASLSQRSRVCCSDQPGRRDKFGRLLVYFLVNGEDASCILIREGYARPWRGKREDWCVKTDLVKISDPSVDCTATGSIEQR